METQAIQDLEVVNQLSAEDKVLVVTKGGEVVLAKKELFKSGGGATTPSGNGVKKYATDEEANAETHEELWSRSNLRRIKNPQKLKMGSYQNYHTSRDQKSLSYRSRSSKNR